MDLDIEFLAAPSWDEQMRPRLRYMQDHCPVYWSEKDNVWVVTRYEDVEYVSKHQELFTSAEGVRPNNPARLGLIDEAEPKHGDLRKMINKGFTPRMVKVLEEKFLEITTDAIDAVIAKGECDFVEDIAVPLPLLLIAEMIGIRKEDRQRFHAWSDAMIAGDGNLDNPEIMAKAGMAFMEYSTYTAALIEERRREPKDDLLSILVKANDEGIIGNWEERDALEGIELTPEQTAQANNELTMLLVILMVAGNETTRNALSGGMQLLIENPEARQRLIDDPSLIPGACEEIVRMVSPVHSFGRTVVEDTEIAGQPVKKGDKVLIIYPAANMDGRRFEDPDRFDIDRHPQHLGFGIGTHFCLGANLARMELRVAFEQLLKRMPDIEYAGGGPVLKPSALVRTCTEMLVKFTPSA